MSEPAGQPQLCAGPPAQSVAAGVSTAEPQRSPFAGQQSVLGSGEQRPEGVQQPYQAQPAGRSGGADAQGGPAPQRGQHQQGRNAPLASPGSASAAGLAELRLPSPLGPAQEPGLVGTGQSAAQAQEGGQPAPGSVQGPLSPELGSPTLLGSLRQLRTGIASAPPSPAMHIRAAPAASGKLEAAAEQPRPLRHRAPVPGSLSTGDLPALQEAQSMEASEQLLGTSAPTTGVPHLPPPHQCASLPGQPGC